MIAAFGLFFSPPFLGRVGVVISVHKPYGPLCTSGLKKTEGQRQQTP